MSKPCELSRARRRSHSLLFAAAIAALPAAASASTTRNWVVGSSDWITPGNWNPVGVPQNRDFVNIINNDATLRTISYDYAGPAVTLAGIFLNNTGGIPDVLSLATAGLVMTSSGAEFIGGYLTSNLTGPGTSALFQSAGTNNAGALDLGFNAADRGNYVLSSNGTLALFAGATEDIAVAGTGTFIQSGGLHFINGPNSTLNIGANPGSLGTYIQTGGILSGAGNNSNEFVGLSGSGTFNQSGGSNAVSTNLYVADSVGSTGAYILTNSASTLSVSNIEFIGYGDSGASNGSFNQSGGLNFIGFVFPSFNITNPGNLYLGYNAAATGTYTLSGGTLSCCAGDGLTGAEYIGESGVGTFNQTGGVNTDKQNSQLSIIVGDQLGSSGSYTLSGTGIIQAAKETIGSQGIGSFNQTGGINQVSANVGLLFIAAAAGSTGTYTLSGTGTLTGVVEELVGSEGVGIFNQSGGVNSILSGLNPTSLNVGVFPGATGTYLLSSTGTLFVSGSEYIGVSGGVGYFNQSGGTNTITANNFLYVGYSAASVGTYTLSANATLSIGVSEFIGNDGTGFFTQIGGSHTISSGTNLVLGADAGSIGTYSLSGGSALISLGTEYVGFHGNGNFNQTSGTNTLNSNNNLALGDFAGSTGTYSLSGTGALSDTGDEFIGIHGNALFNQSGGTNTINSGFNLNIADNTDSTATYALSGGGATVTGAVYVGGSSSASGGTGTITISSSGRLTAFGTMKVYSAGQVNITGGTASAAVLNMVGGGYSQSGGTATFAQITGTGHASISGGVTTISVAGLRSQFNSLSVTGTGKLDITNNAVEINFGAPANDPVAAIQTALSAGYNGGAWTGAAGIVSTIAAAGTPGQTLSVGYADGNTDVSAAVPNQILVKYTLAGDANLDGLVNFNDLVAVVQNFNKAGTDWAHGNFHYSTSTNFNDLVAVVQNFNKTLTPAGSSGDVPGGGSTPLTAGTPISIQGSVVRLPEPGAMCLLALSAASLMKRRRPQQMGRRSSPNQATIC